jgi:uncharacterized protein (TIGR01777 family)
MRVFVTGATGFVGRALVQCLLGQGHEVIAWVRDPARARQLLGADVSLCTAPHGEPRETAARGDLVAALERADAVVNLAGESVLARTWSPARRKALASSRVDLTAQLAAACGEARAVGRGPRVLVSASAVGYYGEQGTRTLDESAPAGVGFLAQLCERWEAAALQAEQHGLRVALLRIGIVLGSDGGALRAMLPAFRLGLGGPLGSGRQAVPFIQLEDLLSVIMRAIEDERVRGPLNCSAPEPVDAAGFARALGAALGRPARLHVPAWALRLCLGARAEVVLQSQRAVPSALTRLGFEFAHPTLTAALARVFEDTGALSIRRAVARDAEGLPRTPMYVLEQRTRLHASPERAFRFFARAENLGLVTPSWMRFEITRAPRALAEGSELAYRIRLGPIPTPWRTIIRRWSPPQGFVDQQVAGPYALWWHSHTLEESGTETLMLDRVAYSLPFGVLGRLAHRVVVGSMLRAIFAYRAEAVARLFAPVHIA